VGAPIAGVHRHHDEAAGRRREPPLLVEDDPREFTDRGHRGPHQEHAEVVFRGRIGIDMMGAPDPGDRERLRRRGPQNIDVDPDTA
jgi:hypothetical protein